MGELVYDGPKGETVKALQNSIEMIEQVTNNSQQTNIPKLLDERTASSPDKTFLFSEPDGRSFTYTRFTDTVRQVAGMLAANGIRKGDVVSLLLPNSVEYVIAYFACWQLGAIAGPINSHLRAQETAFVLSNSEAKSLLVNSEYTPLIDEIRLNIPSLETVIVFDDAANHTGSSSLVPQSEIDPSDEAIIIYTSGTTGKPKGCLLTHGNLIANARQISSWLKFTATDRLLTIMPLFHMNAVSITTMSALYAGASSVVSPKFSVSKFWPIISDYKVTSFGSVATMLSMLLNTYPDGVPDGLVTSQLRFAMCGSAPVPAEVLKRFEETFNCLVIEGYGLSETTCRSTFNPPDSRRRPGSC